MGRNDWLIRTHHHGNGSVKEARIFHMSVRHRRSFIALVIVVICLESIGFAVSAGGRSAQAEEPTPIAGEEFRTRLFGEEIYVPPRDRRSVTAASFGIQAIPNGPTQQEILPFG